jgi:hypothetical protein
VVIATGSESEAGLFDALQGVLPEVYRVGDCVKAGIAGEAIEEAALIGRKIYKGIPLPLSPFHRGGSTATQVDPVWLVVFALFVLTGVIPFSPWFFSCRRLLSRHTTSVFNRIRFPNLTSSLLRSASPLACFQPQSP